MYAYKGTGSNCSSTFCIVDCIVTSFFKSSWRLIKCCNCRIYEGLSWLLQSQTPSPRQVPSAEAFWHRLLFPLSSAWYRSILRAESFQSPGTVEKVGEVCSGCWPRLCLDRTVVEVGLGSGQCYAGQKAAQYY